MKKDPRDNLMVGMRLMANLLLASEDVDVRREALAWTLDMQQKYYAIKPRQLNQLKQL